MRTMNKVLLIGHLGSLPILRKSSQDRTYTLLNLATQRRWKDSEGEWQEKTDWHSITVWGKEAETCVDRLQVGALLMVDGYLSTSQRPVELGAESPFEKRVFITSRKVTFLSRPGTDRDKEVRPSNYEIEPTASPSVPA